LIGAINALQDAVVLVNSIVDMGAITADNMKAAFQGYQEHRYPRVKALMEKSRVMATLQYGQVSFQFICS
jgi:2-polyprenyl-6-methoxyphenol hydroxylase-like FAD-dependent oxidoreductase